MLLTVTIRDPGRGSRRSKQQSGQRERAEVIRGESEFETVLGDDPTRSPDTARIVDKQIDVVDIDPFRGLVHRFPRREVDVHRADFRFRCEGSDPGRCQLGLGVVAARQDHVGAVPRQHEGRLVTDACVRARDHGGAAMLVGHIVLGPPWHS
jgi:hypothetical protein